MSKKINWIILSDSLSEPPHHGGPLILNYISKKLLEFGDRVYMNFPDSERFHFLYGHLLILMIQNIQNSILKHLLELLILN